MTNRGYWLIPGRINKEGLPREIAHRTTRRDYMAPLLSSAGVYGANNKIFTKDAADKARERLREKLSNIDMITFLSVTYNSIILL